MSRIASSALLTTLFIEGNSNWAREQAQTRSPSLVFRRWSFVVGL
jgi:hypothetical protein